MSKTSSGLAQDEVQIPSYEESIAEPYPYPQYGDQKVGAKPSLQQRIAQSRSQRIQEAIAQYIEPHLIIDGFDGITKRTILLIPSDVLPGRTLSSQNLVSAAPTGLRLVRLEGNDQGGVFWQQTEVIVELDRRLKETFGSSLITGIPNTTSPTGPAGQSSLPPRPARKSWLKRTFSSSDPAHDPTGSTGNWNLGWRSNDDGDTKPSPSSGEIHASAQLKEIFLRVETELGLLTTETVKCPWVEIEVGT